MCDKLYSEKNTLERPLQKDREQHTVFVNSDIIILFPCLFMLVLFIDMSSVTVRLDYHSSYLQRSLTLRWQPPIPGLD